ncbi:hypothetical protein [Spirosoma foliorum]|uniref:Glycosyltransferase n=1 Tax=Spirosoma foliorum TaxID=2710596 RepID=A0A7G5GRJ8_9BACT|nr:hypothetical protein [Spirosoma foliorum]QMW01490.1 hypothetical protein H3H32_26540 [Spirosoma foliorum]
MALRILTQINYSAGVNPEGDSGLYFLSKLLLSIVTIEIDIHFYVLVPRRHEQLWGTSLKHQRITPIALNLEPRLHGGSFMFDPADLYTSFDFSRFDIDILFLNQPETAPALLNFLNRQMFNCVPALSYIHWFDTRPPGTPKRETYKPALLGTLSGSLISTLVGVNSQFGKEQIIKQAQIWFNDATIDSLRSKLQVLPPGIDAAEIMSVLKDRGSNSSHCRILVNHRLLNYTGVRNLLTKIFPKVWEERGDFSVHATNPSKAILPRAITHKPWLTVATLEKVEYLKLLGDCDIVVAPHKATHWSISTLEAICAGCVPLMNKESFFPEMIEPVLRTMPEVLQKHINERWFYHRGNLASRLTALMDNIGKEKAVASEFAQKAILVYDWKNIANVFKEQFFEMEKTMVSMPEMTPSLRRILEILLEEGSISKYDILQRLRWRPKDRTIAWTAFRKNLKKFCHESADSPDAVFQLKEEWRIYLMDLVANPLLQKK